MTTLGFRAVKATLTYHVKSFIFLTHLKITMTLVLTLPLSAVFIFSLFS